MTIGTIPHLTDVAVKQQLPTAKHSAFKAPSSPILADSFPGTISTVNTLTSYQTKNTMIPCQDRHPATNSQRLFTCRLQHNGDNVIAIIIPTICPCRSITFSAPFLITASLVILDGCIRWKPTWCGINVLSLQMKITISNFESFYITRSNIATRSSWQTKHGNYWAHCCHGQNPLWRSRSSLIYSLSLNVLPRIQNLKDFDIILSTYYTHMSRKKKIETRVVVSY